MDKQIKKAKEFKKEEVQSLKEKISKSKTLAFADYHGLKASQINDLREKIKAAGGEFEIAKNTLLKKALKENKFSVSEEMLAGPTATIFAYEDEIAPIKEIAETAKAAGTPKFKFGFFGKDLLDATRLEELAQIPPRSVLQSKLVSSLASPIYGTLSVLQANLRNLVYVLDQKSKQNTA